MRPSMARSTTADAERRPQAPRSHRSRPAAQVHADQRRADRLQGPDTAAAVHLRPRQDPLPPRHRPLPEAPAAARAGREARPRARAAALRRRALRPMAQAILLKDVEGLGEAGDGDRRLARLPAQLPRAAQAGPARDQGRPRGGAAPARGGREAEKQAAERAGETAALLSKTVLTINHRAGEDGKLFGSVTSNEIAEAIQAARGSRSTARRSGSRTRSARPAPTWSTSRSAAASPPRSRRSSPRRRSKRKRALLRQARIVPGTSRPQIARTRLRRGAACDFLAGLVRI